MSQPILFKELLSSSNKKIAVATLNAERSLNALNSVMVKALMQQLVIWQHDEDVVMVLLEGAGEKAFCAGGDVVELHNTAVKAGRGNYAPQVELFFSQEYTLDHLIHTYSKPILVYGHGIVMGGGLGLLAGASHRVVTERSKIAMPEITIGLYPDVGASYFLNKMPQGCGLFLGLTGATLNATDAKYVNLADYCISSQSKSSQGKSSQGKSFQNKNTPNTNSSNKSAQNKVGLLDTLLSIKWEDTPTEIESTEEKSAKTENHKLLSAALITLEKANDQAMPESNLIKHQELLTKIDKSEQLTTVVDHILNYQSDSKWLNKAKSSLQHGSPISAHIVKRQLEIAQDYTLADCFRLELALSVHCSSIGEFTEGVRALLVDKDNSPKWQFSNIESVDQTLINRMFISPWSKEQHPLAKLGI